MPNNFIPPSDAVVLNDNASFVPPSDAVQVKKKESTSRDTGLSSKPQGIESSSVTRSKKEQKPSGSSVSGKPEGLYSFPGNELAVYKKTTDGWYVDPNKSGNFIKIQKGDVKSRIDRLEKSAKKIYDPGYEEKINWQPIPSKEKEKKKVPTVQQEIAQEAFKEDFFVTPESGMSSTQQVDFVSKEKAKRDLGKDASLEDLLNLEQKYKSSETLKMLNRKGYDVDINGSINDPKSKKALAEFNAEEDFKLKSELKKDKLSKSIDNIVNSKQMGLTEESTVPLMNKQFGKYGFSFEESGMGDAMKVSYSSDGVTYTDAIDIDLQSSSPEEQASILKSFMNGKYLNEYEVSALNDEKLDVKKLVNITSKDPYRYGEYMLTEGEFENYITKEYRNTAASKRGLDEKINKFEKLSLDYKRTGDDSLLDQMTIMQSDIKSDQRKLAYSVAEIEQTEMNYKQSVGSYILQKEKQGNFVGGIFASLSKGVTATPRALMNVGMDILPELLPNNGLNPLEYQNLKDEGFTDAEIGQKVSSKLKRTIGEEVKQGINNIGSLGTVNEEYFSSVDRNILEQAVFGLAESVGASVSGGGNKVAQGIAFFNMSYNSMADEMADEQFDVLNKWEKNLVSGVYGLAIGQLEKIGFNIASGQVKSPFMKKFTSNVVLNALKGMPENASIETVDQLIGTSLKNTMKAAGVKIVNGMLSEGTTEGIQSLAETGIKNVVSAYHDGKVFDYVPDLTTKKGLVDALGSALEEAAAGAIGGAVMGSFDVYKKSRVNEQSDEKFQNMYQSLTDSNTLKAVKLNEIEKYKNGSITKEEMQSSVRDINNTVGLLDKIPAKLSTRGKRVAFELLSEKEGLEKEIAGKDENLVVAQKTRVAEINNNLIKISEDATKESKQPVQEVTAEGGVSEYQGAGEGQQEVGVGEGIQRDTTVDEADLGDRNIPSQVQEEEVTAKQAEFDAAQIETIKKGEELKAQGLTNEEIESNPDFLSIRDKMDAARIELDALQKPSAQPTQQEIAPKIKSPWDIVSKEEAAYREKQQLDKDNAKSDIDLIKSGNKEIIKKYFNKSGYKEITGNESDTRLKDKKGVYKITGASVIIKKDKNSAALDTAINISNKKIQGLSNNRIEQIIKEFEISKKQPTEQAAQQAEVEVIQPTKKAKEIKSVQEEVDKLRELLGEKPKFKKENETIDVYHGGELGKKTGDIYATEDKSQATEYAKGNSGEITKYSIDKNKISSEEDIYNAISELGIEIDNDSKIYELLDYRFEDTYVGDNNKNKIFKLLKNKGFIASSFMDEDMTGMKKTGVENIIVFDADNLTESSVFVTEGTADELYDEGYRPVVNNNILTDFNKEDIGDLFMNSDRIEMAIPSETTSDVDSVVEEMNSMPEDIANFDIPSDLTTKNKTNINSLIKRFGDKLKSAFKGGIIKDISEYNGIPMIFTISDQLSSGSIKNEFTGSTIDVNGGIGFNLTEGNENNAWANTDKKEAEGMLLRAQDLYSKNKDLFDRLWSEGKLPKGQIPMAIVKMGQDSIATNEALFRFASDTIKRKFNKLERTNSLNGLIEDISAVNPESKVISFIKENNFKTIDELLDNMNRLKPIGERTNVTRFLFTGGILLNTETKPGKPRSKSALALVGDKDSSYYKYIHLQTINNIIEDQSTKYIPSSHIIGITGIDVLNPQITNPKHRNYPYGVKGGLIGILESPVHAADIFPEMYSKSFYLNKENKAGKLPSPKKAVGESVAASGPVAGIKAFRGAKISTKMTEIQKLLGKLRLAFPTVTVVDTQEEFDKTLESKEVKKFVKDGEVVYGFTKDGKIFLNPKKANLNTAIHEFSHIWMGFLKENNPKLLEKAYDLLKGTEILKRKIAEFGDVELAREEALAELIANKGETLIEAGKKSKFKNWLNAVFSYVKSNFKAFDKLTAEEFQNISLNEFVDGSLASLLGGKEITSKEIKNIKVLFSKGKPKDIEDIIKIAKDNDLSDAAIREYLKQQGYTDKQSTAYINEYNIKSEGIFVAKDGGIPTKITNSIRSLRRRMFSARAFLAKSVFAEKENKDAFIAMHLNIVDQVVKDFNRLYKNYKGDKDALVNDFDAYIRGDKDIELPDGFAEVANSMRNQIDGLSNQLISSGLVDVYMAKIIKDNIGQYLTRSYEIFDNKNWKDKVEAEVRQKAINFLRGQYRTMAEDMAIKENMPVEDALNNLVNNRLDEMLTKDSASNFVSGAKLGSKDLSVLKMREDIPVEIRMLMGEYSDPGLNYAKTILKLSSLAANHKFLSEIKQKGMGVYFFEKNDPRRPIQFNTEIATEGSESMKPLNGLYTTKEMAEAFMAQSKQLNDFFKYIMKVQSALRYSKTILSGATHFKNVIGNLGFVWINGHVDPKELLRSYSIIRNDLKKRNIKQKRDKMNEYIRLGIVKQSAGFGEIMDMFKAADWDTAMASRLSNKKLNLLQKSKKFLLQGKKKVEDYYQAEDDFFKIVAYENELSRYSEALFNKPKDELTDDELKQVNDVVVEIVKNTYPTYDRIPEAIKMIRRSPLIGNFVSFQAESYRTAFNTIALAKSEIASKNPKIKVIGAKRIVGATTYLAAKSAIISLYSSAAGAGLTGLFGYLFDDEDEEEKDKDVRKFVAPWSKMSDLVMLFSKPGTLKYIDFSASDPHGGMKKVMNAFFQGEGTLDSFKSAMLETINPFIGEDMAVEAALSLKNNQDKYGNPIYNTEETFNDQLKKVSSYLYKIIEPGTISSVRRGLEAESKSKELIANLTGYRIYEVDINKQFGYSMNNYSTRIADAKKIYNSAYRNEKLTDAQKTEAYNKANKAVKKIYLEIADLYNSAERLGTKPEDLKMNMKEFGNMSAKTISEIQSRKIEPLKKKEEEGVASREVAGPRSGSRSGTRARARY